MGVSRNGLESKVIQVRLQGPEVIAGNIRILLNRIEQVLQISMCRPIGAIPSEFIHYEDLAMAGYSSRVLRKVPAVVCAVSDRSLSQCGYSSKVTISEVMLSSTLG